MSAVDRKNSYLQAILTLQMPAGSHLKLGMPLDRLYKNSFF
ncbi:hypothetical protein NEOC95_002366 [Neochlamydia sp. AcF95]|nr:hypothetical protein [Neochlamydia sp. AcF95]